MENYNYQQGKLQWDEYPFALHYPSGYGWMQFDMSSKSEIWLPDFCWCLKAKGSQAILSGLA